MLRECEGGGNACVWGRRRCDCGEYMGGTRGSGIVSNVYEVLQMCMIEVGGGGG